MILHYMMPYLRPDLKVLDVGCGDGYTANMMNTFSKVTAFDVLEHVSNREEALGIIVERAKKYVMINQPDQEDKSQPFDMAVTPVMLIEWMKEYGFTIIELRHIKLGPTESYNFMVFRKDETYRSSWY